MADELEHQFIISSTRKPQLREKGIKRRILVIWLTGIFLAEIVASGITYPILLQRMQALFSSGQVVGQGQVHFLSSLNAAPGSIDEVEVTIQGIKAAPHGEQYYAWLLIHSENTLSVSWSLSPHNGSLSSTHTDPHLLANNPYLFLITLETAGTVPLSPTFLPVARLYYSHLPSTIQ